jgi:hypothetical protein
MHEVRLCRQMAPPAHLVLALLIHVALVAAVPGHVAVRVAALVEGDEQVGAVVPPSIGQPSFVHLLLQAACIHTRALQTNVAILVSLLQHERLRDAEGCLTASCVLPIVL